MSQLARSLGLPMLVFYGVGMTLGAGIYSIIGKAAGYSGTSLWISVLVAGIAALLTALSYAEISSMYPQAGAEYVYLQKAFPERHWLAAIAGYAMAFAGATTASTVALAFAGYMSEFVSLPQVSTAVVLVVLAGGVAILGIRESGWVNLIFTLLEISGLLAIIYLGIQVIDFSNGFSIQPTQGTLRGAALVIFAFFGFESIVNLANETRQPEKNLPRAIFLCLGIALILYVGVGISATALVAPESLAKSDSALMSVAAKAGPRWALFLGVIALFSTANTALISLIASSRILYGMGDGRALSKNFSQVLPKRKTPWFATLVVLLVAVAFIPLKGGLESVASLASFSTMAAFFMVNLAVIVLRYREPLKKRPFRIPVAIGKMPILPILGGLSTLALMVQFF